MSFSARFAGLVAVALLTVTVGAQAPEPDRVHWVQVGQFADDARAEALRQEVAAAGHRPVCVYPNLPWRSVRVGEFDTYMDAFLVWEDLHETYPDARIRYNSVAEELAAGRAWDFTEHSGPVGPHALFALSEQPLDTSGGLRFSNATCAIAEGGIHVPERVSPEAAAQMEKEGLALTEMAQGDHDLARGLAFLTIADSRARLGEFQAARETALPVADGRHAATPQDRYNAMWLTARTYHALNWRRTAYRAYREIETVCTDPRDRVRCLVEQAGLLMELARSESGRLADCRLLAGRIAQEFAGSEDPEIRELAATAELMAAETWYYDFERERCIEETERLRQRYPDLTRVWAMATLFQATSHWTSRRSEEAIPLFQEILDRPDWDAERDDFPGLNLRAGAARGIAHRHEALGRLDEAEQWWNRVLEEWAGTDHARDAALELRRLRRGRPQP